MSAIDREEMLELWERFHCGHGLTPAQVARLVKLETVAQAEERDRAPGPRPALYGGDYPDL